MRDGSRGDGAPAKGKTTLLDGRWQAGTNCGLRQTRHRHDGLRAAHTRRSPRLHLHERRPAADQERTLRAGSGTTRSELHLPAFAAAITRAYLRHLFAAGELTAAILASHHNVHFYLDLMRQIREAIEFGI